MTYLEVQGPKIFRRVVDEIWDTMRKYLTVRIEYRSELSRCYFVTLLRSRRFAVLFMRSRYALSSCCSQGMKTQRNTILK